MASVLRPTCRTEDQCEALFAAMRRLGEPRWALAMRLDRRSGLRWGELVALHAQDVVATPARVVHVRRAVEQPTAGRPAIKLPKNGRTRTAIFPKSLADDLVALVNEARDEAGPEGLLFPGRRGQLVRRTVFQQLWVKSADAAGWPMTQPLCRSRGYGEKNKGWRWLGAARWSPHDLRHVAACWMLFDVGLDPAVVAEKLGHADPSFTVKRYVGVRGDPDAATTELTDAW